MSISKMLTANDINEMRALRHLKMLRCSCQRYKCRACRTMDSKLCRRCHILTDDDERGPNAAGLALAEIKARILYEYVHGYLNEESILTKSGWVYSSLREKGHQIRILKLVRISGAITNVSFQLGSSSRSSCTPYSERARASYRA